MAILGVGIDIEAISRFDKLSYENNKSFYNKIFTTQEISYCINKSSPGQHFAVRFCAKEAFIKAINQQINDLKKIEIKMNKNIPYIEWEGLNVFVSLSHDNDKAISFVILTNKH